MVRGIANENRPMADHPLRVTLLALARIDALAGSLRLSLEPLSADDVAAGAEPLTKSQIQEELEMISRIVTTIAIEHLQAEPSEWYAAHDAIE